MIELDGRPVARLVPRVSLTIRDRLIKAFDALDEDGETIARLETRIAEFESLLPAPAPGERP